MTDKSPTLCPHCDQPLPDGRGLAHDVRLAHDVLLCSTWNISNRSDTNDSPEYDHRGVQMPHRTRVGGIITPQ